MNPDVPVYNFQSQYDPIPRADLEGLRINGTTDSPGNITNITMPHSGSGIGDYSPGYTHQQETYLRDIATLNGGNGSPENLQKVQDLHAELGVFFTGETTAYTVEFGREVSP